MGERAGTASKLALSRVLQRLRLSVATLLGNKVTYYVDAAFPLRAPRDALPGRSARRRPPDPDEPDRRTCQRPAQIPRTDPGRSARGGIPPQPSRQDRRLLPVPPDPFDLAG